MKYKIYVFSIFLFLLLLIVNSGQVLACSCVLNILPCQRYGYSDAIFIGKAIGIKKEKARDETRKELSYELESTIFEVSENIFGSNKKQITVQNKSDTSCDTSFTQGITYVMFVEGNEKEGFTTNMCAGNSPIESADELIKELRDLSASGAGGKLFGEIFDSLKRRDKEYVPMPNVDVKIQEVGGKQRIYHSITDSQGKYQLFLPQGKYNVTPVIPKYAKLGLFSDEPVFVKNRSCVEKDFSVENDAQITGKLIDSEGKPVVGIWVELVSTDNEKPDFMGDVSAETEENGEFTIYDIPSGRYTLSINFTGEPDEEKPFPTSFYPNTSQRRNAMVFDVGLGQLIDELIFILPPRLVKQKIIGTVLLPDGSPASNVTVNLQRNESDATFSYTKTDQNGNFALNGFIGEKYNFGVDYYGENNEMSNYTVKKTIFTLEKDVLPFRLILEKK